MSKERKYFNRYISHFITINNFQDSRIAEKSILDIKHYIFGGQTLLKITFFFTECICARHIYQDLILHLSNHQECNLSGYVLKPSENNSSLRRHKVHFFWDNWKHWRNQVGLNIHGYNYYLSSSNMVKELLMRNRFSWYVGL